MKAASGSAARTRTVAGLRGRSSDGGSGKPGRSAHSGSGASPGGGTPPPVTGRKRKRSALLLAMVQETAPRRADGPTEPRGSRYCPMFRIELAGSSARTYHSSSCVSLSAASCISAKPPRVAGLPPFTKGAVFGEKAEVGLQARLFLSQHQLHQPQRVQPKVGGLSSSRISLGSMCRILAKSARVRSLLTTRFPRQDSAPAVPSAAGCG